MINPKQLRQIVRFCQKNGVSKFKSGDFEIELTSKPLIHKGPPEPMVDTAAFPSWDSLSSEQKLLWSATPDIQS